MDPHIKWLIIWVLVIVGTVVVETVWRSIRGEE